MDPNPTTPSAEPASPAPSAAVTPPPKLSEGERRVLGVLVEKAKTTPDVYPLSINALVSGCNQKSNRDPLMQLSEDEVEGALRQAQEKGLAVKITGGRVIRWRHSLYEALRVEKVGLAVLGELLLRGPQTEGELRGRASRMEPIPDLDSLRAVLRTLASRGLVVHLSPEGRRGAMVTHGFHEPEELARLAERPSAETAYAGHERAAPARATGTSEETLSPFDKRLSDVEEQVRTLAERLSELQEIVARLVGQSEPES